VQASHPINKLCKYFRTAEIKSDKHFILAFGFLSSRLTAGCAQERENELSKDLASSCKQKQGRDCFGCCLAAPLVLGSVGKQQAATVHLIRPIN